jgi:hypothetical protein
MGIFWNMNDILGTYGNVCFTLGTNMMDNMEKTHVTGKSMCSPGICRI